MEVDGHLFCSSEQAYQHTKAVFNGNFVAANSILRTSDPLAIYYIGKSITCNTQWSGQKLGVMKNILLCKFSQVKEFRDELILTDRKALVECTGNEYWGRGKNGTGKNMLGVLLMQLRYNQFHKVH